MDSKGPDLSGKVAFITGATRGIGKSLALAMAKRGCAIVVTGKTTSSRDPRLAGTIADTAREIEALGAKAQAIRMDVRYEVDIESAVKRSLDRFGRIDYLVNNAGALHWMPIRGTPPKKFDLVMNVNARGAYVCAYHVLPAMLSQNYGHVLMMSPPVDVSGAAGKIGYAISKFGMTLIAHGLAEELAGQNVAANALWPATMIESAATVNWGLGGPATWRKPDIVVDAALRIFAKEPRTFSGHALIDEDFLRSEGVTDFAKYRCDPASEPPRIPFDFKVAAGG
jgi:citronellol/citronellal dehydrogenase